MKGNDTAATPKNHSLILQHFILPGLVEFSYSYEPLPSSITSDFSLVGLKCQEPSGWVASGTVYAINKTHALGLVKEFSDIRKILCLKPITEKQARKRFVLYSNLDRKIPF